MGNGDNELTPIPKIFRTFYDTKANLDLLTGLLDGELGWGSDTTTLYRQGGNGAANWVSITNPAIGGDGHITVNPLSYDSIGQGTWVLISEANCWGRHPLWNSSHTDGDELSYKVSLVKGTYTVFLLAKTHTYNGILDIYIDAAEVASFDLYGNPSVNNVIYTDPNNVIASGGLKTLKLKVDGKHASSTDYYVILQSIVLWRTA